MGTQKTDIVGTATLSDDERFFTPHQHDCRMPSPALHQLNKDPVAATQANAYIVIRNETNLHASFQYLQLDRKQCGDMQEVYRQNNLKITFPLPV
jgi:hypothetical protein